MNNIIPIRRNSPPEELGFEDVLRLAFPNFNPGAGKWPVRTWIAGVRPRAKNETYQDEALDNLDGFIANITQARDNQSGREVALLPVSELALRGIACPYYYSRLGIAYAARQARYARNEYENRKGDRAKAQDELIRAAELAIASIDAITTKYIPFAISDLTAETGPFGHAVSPFTFYEENEKNSERFKQIANASKTLSEITGAVKSERNKYVKTGSPDVWMISFITAIGQMWSTLVGKEPTEKGKFGEYLSVCYAVIDSNDTKTGSRRIATSISSKPRLNKCNADVSLVPLRDLLLSEISVSADVKPHHAAAIKRAIEWEDESPEITMQALRETGQLPASIEALINRLPWAIEDQVADILDIPVEVSRDLQSEINFLIE